MFAKVEETQSERRIDYKPMVISSVQRDGSLFGQYCSDGPALEQLMDNLRTEFAKNPPLGGAYTPKRGKGDCLLLLLVFLSILYYFLDSFLLHPGYNICDFGFCA